MGDLPAEYADPLVGVLRRSPDEIGFLAEALQILPHELYLSLYKPHQAPRPFAGVPAPTTLAEARAAAGARTLPPGLVPRLSCP